MKSRLLKIADYYGFSVRAFEQACNLMRGNISNMSEDGTIGADKLSKIIDNFPDVNSEWLITGIGSMLKPSLPVATVALNSEGIPLIPIEAMAGYGAGENQVLEYECERYVVPIFKDAEFLIQVKGSSMYPKYSSGDVIACKKLPLKDIFFQWNKVYVLDTIQGALIKRIKKGKDNDHIIAMSENEKYEPFELHIKHINSIAIVIGVIRLE